VICGLGFKETDFIIAVSFSSSHAEKKAKMLSCSKKKTLLFHNLKGQVSVKVDRSKREEEREQEDRR